MRVILLLFLINFLYANKIEATYKAKYGWFGTIATSKGVFEKNTTSYSISTVSKAVGIAAAFSKHMVQIYKSEGIVKNNILIPSKYISIRKKGSDIYKRVYIFKHNLKKIIRLKYKNGSLEANETLPYYTKEDILSLYFNFPYYTKAKKRFYTFYALGGRKSDGRVDISFINGSELEKIKDTFDYTKGVYLKVNLYNKVFAGDKGILYLVIDPKNWVTLKGMVKNVLKIGDLKGEIINLKIYH